MSLRYYLTPLLMVYVLAKPCAEATAGGSASRGEPCRVILSNKVSEDLLTHWVDFKGIEQDGNDLWMDVSAEHNSYEGHKFRIRTPSGLLVHEYVVPKCPKSGFVDVAVEPCEKLSAKLDDDSWYDKSWDETFSKLILPTECDESLPTAQWSCVRVVGDAALEAREQGKFGFLPSETKGVRKPYQVKDDGYVEHIPQIPHLTPQAYLIMWQPESMRQILTEFYASNRNTSNVQVHEPIAGMYSNVHSVHMSKLDLDRFPKIRTKVVKEMQKVLEWWTHMRLRHTSTFGIRIYHNDSMLINHVDRHDTHLASAVLQVAQDVQEGWPLELLSETGKPIEAFLQPGQMVLYEGARVFHGRPMRFVGKDFANVFSHFAPLGYGGLGSGEKYDYRFRSGDIEVGWPRVRVGGKATDDGTCADSKGTKKPKSGTAEVSKEATEQEKRTSWWPF